MQIVLEQKCAQGIRLPWVWHHDKWVPASKFEKGLVVWHSYVFWGKCQAGCGEIVVVSQKRQLQFYTQYSFFRNIGKLYYEWKSRKPPDSEQIILSSHFPEDQHVPLNAPSDMGTFFRVPSENEALPLETHPLFLPRVNHSIRHLTQRNVDMRLIQTSFSMGNSMDSQIVYVEQPPLPPDKGELPDIFHYQPILVPLMMTPRYVSMPVQNMTVFPVQPAFTNFVHNSFLNITPDVLDGKTRSNYASPTTLVHTLSPSKNNMNSGRFGEQTLLPLVNSKPHNEKVNVVTETSPPLETKELGICDKLSSMTLDQSSAPRAPMSYAAAVKTRKAPIPVTEAASLSRLHQFKKEEPKQVKSPVPPIPVTESALSTSPKRHRDEKQKQGGSSQSRFQKLDEVSKREEKPKRITEKVLMIEREPMGPVTKHFALTLPKQPGKKKPVQVSSSELQVQRSGEVRKPATDSSKVTPSITSSKKQVDKSSTISKSKTPKTSSIPTSAKRHQSSINKNRPTVAPVIVDVIINKKKPEKQQPTKKFDILPRLENWEVADETMSATQKSEVQEMNSAEVVEKQVTCHQEKLQKVKTVKIGHKSSGQKSKKKKKQKKNKNKKKTATKEKLSSSDQIVVPKSTDAPSAEESEVPLDELLCAASPFKRAQQCLLFNGDDSNRKGTLKKRNRSSSVELESDDEDFAHAAAENGTIENPEEYVNGEVTYQMGNRRSRQRKRGLKKIIISESLSSLKRWKSYERTAKKSRMIGSTDKNTRKIQQEMIIKITEYIRRQTVTRELPHDFPAAKLKLIGIEAKMFDYWRAHRKEFCKKSKETIYNEQIKFFKETLIRCRDLFRERDYNICVYLSALKMFKELPCSVLAFDAQYLKWRMENNNVISVLISYLSVILVGVIQNTSE